MRSASRYAARSAGELPRRFRIAARVAETAFACSSSRVSSSRRNASAAATASSARLFADAKNSATPSCVSGREAAENASASASASAAPSPSPTPALAAEGFSARAEARSRSRVSAASSVARNAETFSSASARFSIAPASSKRRLSHRAFHLAVFSRSRASVSLSSASSESASSRARVAVTSFANDAADKSVLSALSAKRGAGSTPESRVSGGNDANPGGGLALRVPTPTEASRTRSPTPGLVPTSRGAARRTSGSSRASGPDLAARVIAAASVPTSTACGRRPCTSVATSRAAGRAASATGASTALGSATSGAVTIAAATTEGTTA